MTLDQQFNSLIDKISQLTRAYNRVQKEAEKLREELQVARGKEEKMGLQIKEMEERMLILKTASGELSEGDRRDFEKKINQYIREVDKCIAYLST